MTGAYQFLKKYGVAIGFGTGAVLSLLTYVFILGGYPETEPAKEDLYGSGIFDFGLYITYFLIIVATLAVLGFFIVEAVKDFEKSKKSLIMLVILLVVWGVTYMMGDGTLTLDMVNSDDSLLAEGEVFQAGVSQSAAVQKADGLIKFAYVMLFGALASWLFGLVYGFTKQQ